MVEMAINVEICEYPEQYRLASIYLRNMHLKVNRKSPRSRRNLTVIDPLTLPKAPGGGGTQKIVPVHVPFM